MTANSSPMSWKVGVRYPSPKCGGTDTPRTPVNYANDIAIKFTCANFLTLTWKWWSKSKHIKSAKRIGLNLPGICKSKWNVLLDSLSASSRGRQVNLYDDLLITCNICVSVRRCDNKRCLTGANSLPLSNLLSDLLMVLILILSDRPTCKQVFLYGTTQLGFGHRVAHLVVDRADSRCWRR